ncbi:MAG: dihydroxyacetone kinase subunit DhaL [Microbacterium sp.]
MSDITIPQLTDWMTRFQASVVEHQSELTELDSVIGDADHGVNMVRGMDAVVAKLAGEAPATVADLFKTVGMTLVTSVGGASGPLYGTFFLRVGMSGGAVDSLTTEELGAALRAGLGGIEARGKAVVGDKTMVDALEPAVVAWEEAARGGASAADAAESAWVAAETGRDSTFPLVARKGRASYLGERSADHLDPGATSAALLLRALADALGS